MTPKTEINMHPKLFAATITGILISLALAVAVAIASWVTPAEFAHFGLGVYAAPAAALVTTGLNALVGWLKKVQATEAAPVSAARVADVMPMPTPISAAPTVTPADPDQPAAGTPPAATEVEPPAFSAEQLVDPAESASVPVPAAVPATETTQAAVTTPTP